MSGCSSALELGCGWLQRAELWGKGACIGAWVGKGAGGIGIQSLAAVSGSEQCHVAVEPMLK